MFDKFLNFCHRLTLTKQYCVVSAKFTQLNPFLHLFNRGALNYCPVFEFFSAPLFTPPALLNRVPFGCSSGVGPEDRTGAPLRETFNMWILRHPVYSWSFPHTPKYLQHSPVHTASLHILSHSVQVNTAASSPKLF